MAENKHLDDTNQNQEKSPKSPSLYEILDKELTQGLDLYRFIVEKAHIGICIIDDNYTIVYANKDLLDMIGYSFDEIIGKDFRFFTPEKNIPYVVDRYIRRQRGASLSSTYEVNTVRKDGTKITMEISISVAKSLADRSISVVQMFDVTERKKNEQELKESEQRLREIVEAIPIPTYVIDETHMIIHWNMACERLTGIEAIEAIGTDQHWKPFYKEKSYMLADLVVEKASRNIVTDHIHRDFRNAKMTMGHYEAEVFFPDLGPRGKWLLLNAAALKDSKGQVVGAIETLLDMTDKKSAENRLLEMHEVLESQVKERTQGLMEANVALKVLLKKRENDRFDVGEQMVANIREIIFPYIEKLRYEIAQDRRDVLIEIIERNLEEIASPFMRDLSQSLYKLTPSETQIINMIKQNKTTKEIADILNVSTRTVETHRDNIRKKLGIKNRKINLKSYFLSIEQPQTISEFD